MKQTNKQKDYNGKDKEEKQLRAQSISGRRLSFYSQDSDRTDTTTNQL